MKVLKLTEDEIRLLAFVMSSGEVSDLIVDYGHFDDMERAGNIRKKLSKLVEFSPSAIKKMTGK